MKKIYFIPIFLISITFSFAQSPTFAWNIGIGGNGTDKPQDFVIDNNGNIIITGFFSQTVDFNPDTSINNLVSSGGTDIFIAKYSASGLFLWAKKMGGPQNDEPKELKLDASGNIYVTGIYYATANFGTTGNPVNLISNGSADMFIAKYDSNGNNIWANGFGGQMSDASNSLAIDELGNTYTCGNFYGIVDFNSSATATDTLSGAGGADVFIVKYNSSGNFMWAKRIGSNQTDNGVNIDYNNGFIYFTGTFGGTVDFNAGAGVNNLVINGFVTDVFVAKYDTAGSYVWAKSFGSNIQDYVYGIKADASGSIFLTGSFSDTLDIDPSGSIFNLVPTASSTPSNTNDIYFAKFNGVGSLVWAKSIGGSRSDNPNYIDLDANGNVYLTGRFQGSDADFNPATNDTSYLVSSSINTDDIFISKYNNLGEYVWAYSLGGAQHDIGQVIKVDNFGSVYFTGSLVSTNVDFDFGIGTSLYSSAGSEDVFIAKYNQCNLNNNVTLSGATLNCATNNGATYQWVNCNGFTNINGATSQTYTATQSGDYAVIISAGGCIDTSSCITINVCDLLNLSTTVNNNVISSNASGVNYQWFDCNANSIISGAIFQSYTPNVNGSYSVIINQNNCTDTSNCAIINTIGINDLNDLFELTIFPNPSSDFINIKYNNLKVRFDIDIIDLLGKSVSKLEANFNSSKLNKTYDIKFLNPGIYFLRLIIDNKTIIKKFVKN